MQQLASSLTSVRSFPQRAGLAAGTYQVSCCFAINSGWDGAIGLALIVALHLIGIFRSGGHQSVAPRKRMKERTAMTMLLARSIP
jgi:hypothetical protein